MIDKFITIQNIGRFRNCTPRGDVTFGKLTLLFAENGRGKTTLCSILRSLQSGKKEFILERKTLGSTGSVSVQLRLGGSNISFVNNAWSSNHPDIAIFDSVFIHDNVFAGDYVEHDHKKNLYRVIIGAQGVQLAKQIEELDGKIRDANNEISEKKSAVMRTLPVGVSIDVYRAWIPVEDVDNKILQQSNEIANRQRALEKATDIQSKGLLAKISLPLFPSDFTSILAKQITDVTANAESCVRQQIANHKMGKYGESWLSQGLGFVANDKCPFCGQDAHANELISAYRSHFNIAYKALIQEVTQLSQSIKNAIGEAAINATQQVLSSNLILVEFWKQFTQIALPDLTFDTVCAKYAKLRDLALALALKKHQSPTEFVPLDSEFQGAFDAVTNLQQLLQSYNTAVDTCNALVSQQKTAAQTGRGIDALKKELTDLEAKKIRFDPTVVQACREYQDALSAKTALEQQKTVVKQQLDQHCEQIIQTYEEAINTYLDQFSAGFRLANSRHLYTGGTPSSHYQIKINNTAIDLGDSRTQSGTPCFKTALSSGDRSALALAFFLAALKHDTQLQAKIIIFDDPFTSLDCFRRACTQQLIRQIANKAEQVIVLSHDPQFLKLLWDSNSPANIKVLQLCRVGDNTVIGEWDIQSETQSTYIKNYSALLDYYRDRVGRPLDVARAIRPFVEGLLRAHFPGHFQTNEWLGDFIGKIRSSTDTDGLSHAKADLPEIEAINDYSKKYHHDQNQNAESEHISADELHGFVKRTMKLVGGC